ncbi:hypothetical protein [Antarcticirhabdus aurantiaca]|uniref:Uncharacterized protein n=1 Tax=Antarcticirhabdus aurantiaca TaxID=2606717 RepID=A0ACD4NIP8_9HYPH|nr:hypothetical protein [Antarcticirhabdus aurantiaca]WAJ26669.1 hypothetical protein OXU80_17575 [Jeongeuplla avenae]
MKAKLHLKSNAELLNQSVSKYSLWYDHLWIFDNPTAGQRLADSTINWKVYLPDQSYLTDPKWANLLDAFRRLIWSLYTSPLNGVRYKPGMASDFSRQVTYFACWMVYNGYHSFSELDSTAFDEYVESVYEDKAADPDNPPTATLLMKYLRLPPLMWVQSSELKLAGTEPPPEEPYEGLSAFAVAKGLAEDRRGQHAPIEDELYIKIMSAALSVIEDIDDIAACIDLLIDMSEGRAPDSRHKQMKMIEAFLREVSVRYPRALPYVMAHPIWPTWGATALVREAASILILGGVGLRTTELCGLVASPDPAGLPACVSIRPSISGLDEIFLIRGRVYKGEQGWADHEWVAGTRPVGTDQLPPPIKAVFALERLFRRFRTSENMQRLVLYSDRPQGWLKGDEVLIPSTTEFVRRAQRAFVQDHVGVPDCDISPSQWRKSFAQFVVRTDSRSPPSLRDHFRHVSLAITELGYGQADPDYKQVMEDAAVQNSIDFLGAMVTERNVAVGPMVDIVRASADRIGMRLGNRDGGDRRNDIEEIVLGSEIRVHKLNFGGQPAGNCVFRPGVGRCTEGCLAKWVMPAPLWSAARADVCWDCENLVLSPEHGVFWQARWSRHHKALKAAVASDDACVASLARTRMAQCAVMLARLGLPLPEED